MAIPKVVLWYVWNMPASMVIFAMTHGRRETPARPLAEGSQPTTTTMQEGPRARLVRLPQEMGTVSAGITIRQTVVLVICREELRPQARLAYHSLQHH